jgi:branched-chain amino acid transport system substrate-binding protein
MPHRPHRRIFLGCLALAAVLAWACARNDDPREELRLGLICPLSQSERFTGHLLAQARVEELNASGGVEVGGRKRLVRLIVADSAGQVEQTLAAITRLVQQERVSAIIGPFYSREALPAAAALESLRVPMVTPAASNPEITRGRAFVFRVCQVDSTHGQLLARHVCGRLGLRHVAAYYDEADAYSSGLTSFFLEAARHVPGVQTQAEHYLTGTQDFAPGLRRLRAKGVQALLLPNFPSDLARQLRQARAEGFDGMFLGGDSWDADVAFHSLPEAQGALFTTDFVPEAANPTLFAHAIALAEKSGAQLVKNSALTLDALDVILAAAGRAGSTDPVSLREGLSSLRGFEGLTSKISFSSGGDPERTTYLVRVSGGRATLLERLEPGAGSKP